MVVEKPKKELAVQNIIFTVIVSVWAFGFIADVFSVSFELPTEVTAVVGAIVAYFTASVVKSNVRDGKPTRRRR